MKKILLALVACAGALTSCDMNTTQYGVIDDSTKMGFDYLTQNRTYTVYSYLRSASVAGWVYNADLQCDQFIGLVSNGSRGQNITDGIINSSNGTTASYFNSCYTRIAQINYCIEQIEGFNPTQEQAAEVARYKAEAHFARAYFYFYLFDHFCPTYTEADGDTPALGLQLVTYYEPTGDTSKYPGRSTQNETLTLINGDLKIAFDGLQEYEKDNDEFTKAGANYLSSYAVAALQARVALVTGQYATAIEKADYVIGNTNYTLATGDDYVNMWADKYDGELIFAPYFVLAESGGDQGWSTCQGWNYWWSDSNQSDYIPTEETVEALCEFEDNDGYLDDCRFYAFIYNPHVVNIGDGAQTQTYIFQKYPGNPALSGNTNFYVNKGKPFRLSEQYLIKAEAAALSSQNGVAQQAINDLMKARYYTPAAFTPTQASGSQLLALIRSERSKELLGEGFRLSDLRRWKQGFDRNQPYTINPLVAQARWITDLNVVYSNDDYRYVWPIPSEEMQINPQLAGQQNRGY